MNAEIILLVDSNKRNSGVSIFFVVVIYNETAEVVFTKICQWMRFLTTLLCLASQKLKLNCGNIVVMLS